MEQVRVHGQRAVQEAVDDAFRPRIFTGGAVCDEERQEMLIARMRAHGVRRAFATYMAKDRLNSMRRSAMSRSFSWDISAACYSALYRKALSS